MNDCCIEEAKRWASQFCSAHQIPDASCHICNTRLILRDLFLHHQAAAYLEAAKIARDMGSEDIATALQIKAAQTSEYAKD